MAEQHSSSPYNQTTGEQASQLADSTQTFGDLSVYSTTISDIGTVRSNNQDSSFAGKHLLAVCDGMGGHAGGDTASTIAIRSLAHIEHSVQHTEVCDDVSMMVTTMERSVMAAHDAIAGKAKRDRHLASMGTTVTAVTLVDGYWVLAHIGDSRAYLLRDGQLMRMTHDHSYVQHLIDTGRISESEARNHPQRNIVMRVLGDFDIDPRPDICVRRAHPTDRWLLCSDGLCGVLADETIRDVLISESNQETCAQRLVSMALKAGSTDNVTVVIADTALRDDADSFNLPHQTPLVGGAANIDVQPIADIVNETIASAPSLEQTQTSPAQRAAALAQVAAQASALRLTQPSTVREEIGERINPDTDEIPIVRKKNGRVSTDPNDPEVASALKRKYALSAIIDRIKRRRLRLVACCAALAMLVASIAGAVFGYRWLNSQYYIGESQGSLVIYQGVHTNIFGISLSHEVERYTVTLGDLSQAAREELTRGINVGSLTEARSHIKLIMNEIVKLRDTSGSTGTDSADGQEDQEGQESQPGSADASDKQGEHSEQDEQHDQSSHDGGDQS